MTRADLYARALRVREQVSTWQGCDLRGQPADVRAEVLSLRYHANELCSAVRARLTDAEVDEAHRLAWPPPPEPSVAKVLHDAARLQAVVATADTVAKP